MNPNREFQSPPAKACTTCGSRKRSLPASDMLRSLLGILFNLHLLSDRIENGKYPGLGRSLQGSERKSLKCQDSESKVGDRTERDLSILLTSTERSKVLGHDMLFSFAIRQSQVTFDEAVLSA